MFVHVKKMEWHLKSDIRIFSTRIVKLRKTIEQKCRKKHENENWNEIPQNCYDKSNFQPKKEQPEEKMEDTDERNEKVKLSRMENNVQGIH